ncbi:MAG: response regulator [Balneolaceae bacterium]|nr:response regulator [Balneolaceae bacterium]
MKKNTAKNVLIVEDDMLLSLVEERLIQKLGHNVVGKVTTGKEAIEKSKELSPDLIMMDIILKGEMDGIEAMEKIREESEVPVIYLSGNSDRYNFERAKKTQFTDYLVKPITSKDLKKPMDIAFSNDVTSNVENVTRFQKTA